MMSIRGLQTRGETSPAWGGIYTHNTPYVRKDMSFLKVAVGLLLLLRNVITFSTVLQNIVWGVSASWVSCRAWFPQI